MTKKLLLACSIGLLLSACASETTLDEDKAKRAAELNARLGVGYMRQGKYEIAKEKLDKALSQDPDNGDIYHYMAELYRRLNEPKIAEGYYQEAMSYNMDDSALKNNYAVFLCEQNKYKEADEYFNKVLSDPIYERKDLVYENMGLCAQHQGNLLLAEEHLNRALGMNPRLPTTVLTLAQISFDKQLLKQADFHYKRYLKMAQHTSQSLWLGYLLEKQIGNKNKAASYAVLLKGKFPDSKEAKLLRKIEAR